MKLQQFLKIVRRSWLLVAVPPLLALLLSVATLRLPPPRYALTAKIAVTQSVIAPPDSSVPDFNSYHSWAASEYIADDLPAIVTTETFARDLQAWLKQQRGIDMAAAEIRAGLSADRVHRVINLHVAAPSPEAAQAIAEGTAALLEEKGLAYWDRREQGGLNVALLEVPPAGVENRWRQPAWTVVLRVVLALGAGLFLAFVRYAADPIIRDEDDLEALGLELIAAIPAEPAIPAEYQTAVAQSTAVGARKT
ncbi:MAG: hypothetical protein KatS3mg057_2719 [Herpetosiphonaceae bacterium]|nr:MAG: hypothetical protein KatS3mg057_2719 [Herpetosiphonaceae bacterium]